MTDITNAIKALRPNSSFGVIGDRIKWNDPDNPQPTEKEINEKIKELQADYDAKKYQRDRAADYPSWQEQMDLLYHGGVDALKAELKKTKDKFPKPE